MSILEEFWYGNLDPSEYDANPSEEYKELIRLISWNEEKLLATMTECLLFQNSFRLGARMMLEVMEKG